uniref:Regulatory protein SIR2 homolog 7 n=1 Tax=Plectus sambesii TaxID=2011161 RepID=A0A914WDA6_9BILA
MALRELYKRGLVRHILSQNCDGLHLRSGVPQKSLSEIHGNMHIEVCREGCSTLRQYIRPYDVTKKSQFRRHKTGRSCDHCHTELDDTIVHFGEVGRVQWPLNWAGTTDILEESSCDLLICLGTSLAVLKQYAFLWPTGEAKKRAKIVIINLQWTPKDRVATLKIHAKCDDVMTKLMQQLGAPIPEYCRTCDPILNSKRSARSGELMSRITECSCAGRGNTRRNYAPPSPDAVTPSNDLVTPGWWTVGISRSLKRSLTSVNSGQTTRRKTRGKRAKASKTRSQRIESSSTNDSDQCAVQEEVSALVEWLVSSV